MTASVRSTRVPIGKLGVDVDFTLVGLGQELGRQKGVEKHGEHDRRHCAGDDGRPMSQRHVERLAVRLINAVEEAFAGPIEAPHDARSRGIFVRRGQPAGAQHRHDGHRDEERHREREHDDDRELAEEDARRSREEQQRNEHGDVGQRGRENRRPHLFTAIDGGRHLVLAHVQMPMGVLEHDDRGVDDHADAQREAAEGHGVQRVTAEVEERERPDRPTSEWRWRRSTSSGSRGETRR